MARGSALNGAVNFLADLGATVQSIIATFSRPTEGKLQIYCHLSRRRRTGEMVTYTVLSKPVFRIFMPSKVQPEAA